MDLEKTSISLRGRRTILQDAFVSVPLSRALRKARPEADGSHRLDLDALVAEGVRLSNEPGVEWQDEQRETTPHPRQRPIPAERTMYRPERRG